jgi:hypothetical protein
MVKRVCAVLERERRADTQSILGSHFGIPQRSKAARVASHVIE